MIKNIKNNTTTPQKTIPTVPFVIQPNPREHPDRYYLCVEDYTGIKPLRIVFLGNDKMHEIGKMFSNTYRHAEEIIDVYPNANFYNFSMDLEIIK